MITNSTFNTETLLREAECNEVNNRLQKAIELYETAIAQNADQFDAYYNLGAIYEKMQDTNKAKDIYKRGISTAKLHHNKTIETELSFTLLGLID